MTCTQFRGVLDCYVDGELSAEAMAAAHVHLRECGACARVVEHLNSVRGQLRDVVAAHAPPPDLEQRVLRSLRPDGFARYLRVAAAAAVLIAVGIAAGMLKAEPIRHAAADALDRAVLRLAGAPRTVELEATVLCRDCELHSRYGAQTFCDRIGHHGAIATADGRLWNIVEQDSSADLIYDDTLLGRKVHVRGRLFRDAGSIVIETYELTDVLISRHFRASQGGNRAPVDFAVANLDGRGK